jgi:hypothetical protein
MAVKVMPAKQPSEVLDYDFTYSSWLPTGDTVVSAVVTVDDATLNIAAKPKEVSETQVKVWIGGGTNNVKYKVTCKATTAQGRVKEDEMIIQVKES